MALKVYGTWVSTCTRRVLCTLYEKNVTNFVLEPTELSKKAHKSPEYMKMQPFGQIPCLQDGSFTIFESRAIARYIADKYKNQGTPLYGKTAADRARVEEWLEVESQNFNPPIHDAVTHIAFGPVFDVVPDPVVIEKSLQQLEKVLDVYEKHLADKKYLAGNFFSLADISHLSFTDYLIGAAKKGELINSRENVKAWWERCSSRDSWKKVRKNNKK